MSKRADQFVVGIERRVREMLRAEFDGALRLRELYDAMAPLLSTWESDSADAVRLDEFECEAQAIRVAMRVKGTTWDRRTVSRILDEVSRSEMSGWIESEVLSSEVQESGGVR